MRKPKVFSLFFHSEVGAIIRAALVSIALAGISFASISQGLAGSQSVTDPSLNTEQRGMNAGLFAERLSALIGVNSNLLVRAPDQTLGTPDDARMRTEPIPIVESNDAVTVPQVFGLFFDAKKIASYLIGKRQGQPVGSIREETLLRECESAIAASHLVTQFFIGQGARSWEDLNDLNSKIAMALNEQEPVPVAAGPRPGESEPTGMPPLIAGPDAPPVPSREFIETAFPWFDAAVAYLVASAGSGMAAEAAVREGRSKVPRSEIQPPINSGISAVVDRPDLSESFGDWAQRACRRFMFLDSSLVDYIAIEKRSIRDEGRGIQKMAKVDVDIVNVGSRPLKGSMLFVLLGVADEGLKRRFNLQYAKIVPFQLRPKEKQRYVDSIPYRVPAGEGVLLMMGPEIGNGPIAATATGPAEPIDTCAEKLATGRMKDAWGSPLAAYALDAAADFMNSTTNQERSGLIEVGKHSMPDGSKVDVVRGGTLSHVTINLVRQTSEEAAKLRFKQMTNHIQKLCGKKVLAITRGEQEDETRMFMDYKMFSPNASMSIVVRKESRFDKAKAKDARYSATINISRHSRIFP